MSSKKTNKSKNSNASTNKNNIVTPPPETVATPPNTTTEQKKENTESEPITFGDVIVDGNKNEYDEYIEKKVVEWMKDQLRTEKKRIETMGSKSIEIEVKNTGIIKEGKNIHNRIEMKTSFDFDKIVQIMISDAIECPVKKNYYYVNVLLFPKDKPIPLIVPYIYLKSADNKLTDWIFINNQLKSSNHQIKEFTDVQ
ncbi:WD40 repeat-containing protein [Tieghemostelium lacteum]|uniref:WD40 repeat-containing protein n=1 Tax=Tieghemostelium lacteum TaxID=361077 RepID=A0A152A936_TIELA|nr:WD40 repeat-containing protein [Tieghemostelium lacteum]|eukprot:KYR02641.1 WD40 repeat-containing protein [Tieghemostelium lacteum]